MTVAELITQLQTLPQDISCRIYSIDSGEWVPLISVSYVKGNDVVHLETAFDIE